MPTIRVLPTFPERPTNPARCYIHSGVIEINKSRFDQLPMATQEYVLNHELGHYHTQSFDEVKADQYALRKMALKKPYSLRNYLDSVNNVSYGNKRRVEQAKHDVLTIAANNGSSKAKELLQRMGYASADGSITWVHYKWLGIIMLLAFILIITIVIKHK